MKARIPGSALLILSVTVLSAPAQTKRPTPTPKEKEKIIHPSAVALPTPVRADPEVLQLNLEKMSLPDAVDFLERLTGEKHAISMARPPAEIFLNLKLQGPKLIVIQQLRQVIAMQAAVRIERVGAGWAVTDRPLEPAQETPSGSSMLAAPATPSAPRPRPHPIPPKKDDPAPPPAGAVAPTPTPTR